jgi:hypothetical protein
MGTDVMEESEAFILYPNDGGRRFLGNVYRTITCLIPEEGSLIIHGRETSNL